MRSDNHMLRKREPSQQFRFFFLCPEQLQFSEPVYIHVYLHMEVQVIVITK